MPHISMNRNSQNPSALWRSQLKRRHPALHFTPRLRFQRLTPGHQTTSPVSEETREDGADDAVPEPPGAIEQQLVVQPREPQHEVLALRHRVAEVLAGVRVEEALLLVAAFSTQTSIVGLRRVMRSPTRVMV